VSQSRRRPNLASLTWLFLRVGNTTFGGGDPTIAVLQREFYRRGWLSAEQFAIAFGLARVTPGTNILAFCAATGWYIAGLAGALAAVFAESVPSSVLVVWLTHVYELGIHSPRAQSVISATIAAAVGTMIAAAVLLIKSQCSKSTWVRPIALAAAAFALARWLKLSPLQVIAMAAMTGFFWVDE
jgi:chromate transporter